MLDDGALVGFTALTHVGRAPVRLWRDASAPTPSMSLGVPDPLQQEQRDRDRGARANRSHDLQVEDVVRRSDEPGYKGVTNFRRFTLADRERLQPLGPHQANGSD